MSRLPCRAFHHKLKHPHLSCSRPHSEASLNLPTLGTTVSSPSEQYWVSHQDSKDAAKDELPYAFVTRANAAEAGRPRGHGVSVPVEKEVA